MFDSRPGGRKSVLHRNGGRTSLAERTAGAKALRWESLVVLEEQAMATECKCGEPEGEWFELR